MKQLANIPKVTLIYVVLIAFILVSYSTIRILNLSQAVQKVKTTADTPSYVRISKESVLGTEFVANTRPLLFPLLLKLFGGNIERVAWAQGVFSMISWSILAASVAYSLQLGFLRFAAFGLILLLSLYRYVIGWDSVMLTESLSLSFMVLFIASWLWLMKGWRWQKAIIVMTMALLWAFCRDTNAWVVLMVALFLVLLFCLRYIDKKYLTLSAAFILIFFLSNLSADVGGRWIFPFQNVLGQRILPNAEAINFFANCGMPVSPELIDLAGEFSSGQDRAFYLDPALVGYRSWLYQSGKACYVKWLVSNPIRSIQEPITEFNSLISLENIQPFLFSKRFSPILPGRLEAILFPHQQPLIVFAVICGITLIAILTKAWKQNKVWWVVIVLNVLVFPHYFIIWHGDVMGIYRHVLMASIQFYLGVWMLILFAADSILSFQAAQEGFVHRLLSGMQNNKESTAI